MPFEWIVAIRYLREGRAQTLLILSGIGVGVAVMIFISALITGLQQTIIARTLGTQAHIVVRPLDDIVRPQRRSGDGTIVATHIENPTQRVRSILRWQQAIETIRTVPGVIAVAPTVAGPAFAIRGLGNKSVALRGVDENSYTRIVNLQDKMIAGEFRLRGTDVVIGRQLAKDLALTTGEKLRLLGPDGQSQVFTVAGIFDAGNKDLNERWVFVSIRSAQTLLNMLGGISTIEVKVGDIFAADAIARVVGARTSLLSESWMQLNSELLVALRSQSSSSYMIQFFVIIAVALGIASVLIVAVVQKAGEIGILRAIGASTNRILRVFLIQGAILGIAGAVAGIVLGSLLALSFSLLARNPDGSATFPVALTTPLFTRAAVLAVLTGLLSAVAPARRAALLDPVEVIRHG